MKTSPLFILISNLLFAVCYLNAQAQTKDLDNEQVNVVKPYQPTLSDAYKISDMPEKDTSVTIIRQLDYSVEPEKINTFFEVSPIKPVKIKDETISKLYKNFVKIGGGNYSTPYAELFVNNLRSKDYSAGIHMKHISSKGQLKNTGFSGFSNNEIGLYGKRFLENKSTLSANFSYHRDVVHFYGYNASDTVIPQKNIRQRFHLFETQLKLTDNHVGKDSSNILYRGMLGYYNLKDLYGTTENCFSFDASAGKFILNNDFLEVDGTFDYTGINNTKYSNDAIIFGLKPQIEPKGSDSSGLSAKAGVNFMLETDSSGSTYHLYPQADVSYKIADDFLIGYGTVGGGIVKNGFRQLTDENPFINPVVAHTSSNNKLEVALGVKGTFNNATSFNLRGQYNSIEELPLFVAENNISGLDNKYTVVYDNAELWNVHAELGYYETEKLQLIVKGDYYHFIMASEQKPWHRPALSVALTAKYGMGNNQYKDKIVLTGDVFVMGNRYAQGTGFQIKKLKPFADVNLGVDYRYSKIMSFFLRFNNIASVKYYRWNSYPLQRFNLLGGLSYSF